MQSTSAIKDDGKVRGGTHTFGEASGSEEGRQMAFLGLTHTKVEHQLYRLMLTETKAAKTRVGEFSVRHLMIESGCHSYSGIRSARRGLIKKMSIDRQKVVGGSSPGSVVYVIYTPAEIFARRREAGLSPRPREVIGGSPPISMLGEVVERLIEKHSLSRREVEVALSCAEGLTNAKIGEKLFIHKDTVKFHLRNIYIKFGVKRRTELMAYLFRQERSE